MTNRLAGAVRVVARRLKDLARNQNGAASPLIALLLVPMLGAVGLGIEGSNWYLTQRAMQNAADSAVQAAAVTGGTTSATPNCLVASAQGTFDCEALAVAKKYGFTSGGTQGQAHYVAVSATYASTGCPSGSSYGCYKVAISENLPLYMLTVVGYRGNGAVFRAPYQTVAVSSVVAAGAPYSYCVFTLGGGTSLTMHGVPKANLHGCSSFSIGNSNCTGQNPGIDYGDATGTSGCGNVSRSSQPTMADPWASVYTSASGGYIPAAGLKCASYPTATGASIPAANTISSTTPFNSVTATSGVATAVGASAKIICGNASLTTDVNVTTPNAVLVVYNGSLDLQGHKLSTSGAGSLTVIFSGTVQNGTPQYTHAPVDTVSNGQMDIAAPASGPFAGAAMIQDNSLTGSGNLTSISYAGNAPAWDIQGLLYMPNGALQLSGAIGMFADGVTSTVGLSCIGLVSKTLLINGTGAIFSSDSLPVTQQCGGAGLTLGHVTGTTSRIGLALVQ